MGKSFLFAGHLIWALLLLASNALAQQQETQRMEAVDRFIEEQMRKQQIPGLALAVVKDGQLLLTRGYGLADVELNVPATPQTVWQIQSITKPFVAAAIMMLQREKKLSLDDELGKHLDGVPPTWNGITIRRILNHTSGIKDYINEPFASLRIDISDEEVLKQTAQRPLNFAPGEKYAYCNTGYLLAGMIIRKHTAKPYGDFLQERIFGPLGMTQTRVQEISEIIPRRASGYRVIDGKLRKGEFIAQSILSYPGGGIISTVLDMAKFDAMWQDGKLIDDSVRQEMWTTPLLNSGLRSNYALGFGIGDLRGWRQITHSGGHITGFASRYAIYPQQRLSVIVLTNRNEANTDVITQGVAGRIEQALMPAGMMTEIPETDAALLERLVNAVTDLAGQATNEQLIAAPLRKAIMPETKKLLAEALPTTAALKFLGSDDLKGKDTSSYGVPMAELRHYRMKHPQKPQKMRYFKFYLTEDRKVTGVSVWDD
jgi:D-alanyl-D-alanine carboxypeptidase